MGALCSSSISETSSLTIILGLACLQLLPVSGIIENKAEFPMCSRNSYYSNFDSLLITQGQNAKAENR